MGYGPLGYLSKVISSQRDQNEYRVLAVGEHDLITTARGVSGVLPPAFTMASSRKKWRWDLILLSSLQMYKLSVLP